MASPSTALSLAYTALWDAEAKEHAARTAYLRAIGTSEYERLYGIWFGLNMDYDAAREKFLAERDSAEYAAEVAYNAAQQAERTARENYEREMLILVLPQLAPTAVHYTVLGPRNTVPRDTWMDAGLYGVSELGLRADIRDQLVENCTTVLELEKTRSGPFALSEGAGHELWLKNMTAHGRIKAILAESPRVGLWKATRAAES